MTIFKPHWFSLLILFFLPVSAQDDSRFFNEHLVLGNPSGATADTSLPENYLMVKQQFILSYNRTSGLPNWVAWHTDSTWLGPVKRSNDFRADSTLPAAWYRVHENSFRRSGFDRGHMCPSADRTNTQHDNSMTFLMTNMIPQAPNNNRGPWAAFEMYCRDLVRMGKELYTYCGGIGMQGMLDSGRVIIPEQTWKTVLILDAGDHDLQRVTNATRVISIVMPNSNNKIGLDDNWKNFRISVDSLEILTRHDFFSSLPISLQQSIESTVDIVDP